MQIDVFKKKWKEMGAWAGIPAFVSVYTGIFASLQFSLSRLTWKLTEEGKQTGSQLKQNLFAWQTEIFVFSINN